MVRQFTEEERARQWESVRQHEERFHNGERSHCNSYSECWKIEREEREAKSSVG